MAIKELIHSIVKTKLFRENKAEIDQDPDRKCPKVTQRAIYL